MKIQIHTPVGAFMVDSDTVTPEQLSSWGVTFDSLFSPDLIRATELLATSPAVITMPEIWELLRLIGRRLGYIT